MKQLLIFFLLLFISLSSAYANSSDAVVKIFTAASTPNYQYPWQTSQIQNYTGSGVIIEGERIITSAHVVSGAKFIEVSKENDPQKYIATLKFISHQADLAILEVEDPLFYKGTKALSLSTDIHTHDKVTVLGYPLGGNTISTTTGIISRIEYIAYVWSNSYLLGIQIDAAINSGNSGGAVIDSDDNLVGIAMMTLQDSSNIGYIVPTMIIKTFLEDIKDGRIDGFHEDSVTVQIIDNDALKEYYQLGERSGILVTHIGVDEKTLKVNDIILNVDGYDIANNGTIKTEYGRIALSLPYHTKQLGESVELKVYRDQKEITLKQKLKKVDPLIKHEFAAEPRYLIYGGLTFTPLTRNYLRALSNEDNSINMLFYQKDKRDDYDEPVISLPTIFPNNVNRGYRLGSFVLVKVNDIKIKNFKHLLKTLDENTKEFTVFEFLEKTTVILNTKEAKESIKELMQIYYLKSDRRE